MYLATRLRDNKLVAVKAFSKERQYAGEKGKSSLENEVQIMRKLTNPYVMKFLALYESENSIYIILEYLQGTQLNNLLKDREPISLRMIRPIMTSLLRGLAYLS